jgi:hypothetical protein
MGCSDVLRVGDSGLISGDLRVATLCSDAVSSVRLLCALALAGTRALTAVALLLYADVDGATPFATDDGGLAAGDAGGSWCAEISGDFGVVGGMATTFFCCVPALLVCMADCTGLVLAVLWRLLAATGFLVGDGDQDACTGRAAACAGGDLGGDCGCCCLAGAGTVWLGRAAAAVDEGVVVCVIVCGETLSSTFPFGVCLNDVAACVCAAGTC